MKFDLGGVTKQGQAGGQEVTESCNSLRELLNNPMAIFRLESSSPTGNIFVYGDWSTLFASRFFDKVNAFNAGDKDAFDNIRPWQCSRAGSTIESATDIGAKSKGGGYTVELNPKTNMIVGVYDQHQKKVM